MSVRNQILEMLGERQGAVTGEEIGERLGITRSAVWRHIKVLRREGFNIHSRTNSGYILESEQTLVNAAMIVPKLQTKVLGRDIDVFADINSTNTFLKSLSLLGANEGKTVIAQTQKGGRGQLGHDFFSPPGSGLYMSVLIRPKIAAARSQLLTTAAATAVTDALLTVTGNEFGIKWVNDIYSKKKKLCGILAEASSSIESAQLEYAVIGIGINVNNTSFPKELKRTATSLYLETGRFFNRNEVAAAVLNALEKRIEQVESGEFLQDYRARSILIGKQVCVTQGNDSFKAKALGIDDFGRLVVKSESGKITTISSGSVRLL
ncbi:MAG: biotin--[acetyl-CoA-carboxylase] ligase [Ruminococcus sp.]|nr:biotin--[acetyl-CoA-carboxylase] ligase [Ruminococcus sp.]